MVLDTSWLSQAARYVSDFLGTELDKATHDIYVELGSPGVNSKLFNDRTLLNLFFYQVESSGIGPDGAHDEPAYMRLLCLMSTFGVAETHGNQVLISAGEMELRVLGEVVRVFHETPVLGPLDVKGETITLQVVPRSLGLEDLNHLWSSQGEAIYHPSTAYEFAVAPVVPNTRAVPPAKIGSLGIDVRPDMDDRWAAFAGTVQSGRRKQPEIDLDDPEWAPQIYPISDEETRHVLVDRSAAGFPVKLSLQMRGEGGATIKVAFEKWQKSTGWEGAQDIGEFALPAPVTAGEPVTLDVELDHPLAANGQALIYARREPGAGAAEVRSDPLLVSYVGV